MDMGSGAVIGAILVALVLIGAAWSAHIAFMRANQIPSLTVALSRARVTELPEEPPTQVITIAMLVPFLLSLASKEGNVAEIIARELSEYMGSDWRDVPDVIRSEALEKMEVVVLSAVWCALRPKEDRPSITYVRECLKNRTDTEYCFTAAADYAAAMAEAPEAGQYACAA